MIFDSSEQCKFYLNSWNELNVGGFVLFFFFFKICLSLLDLKKFLIILNYLNCLKFVSQISRELPTRVHTTQAEIFKTMLSGCARDINKEMQLQPKPRSISRKQVLP